MKPLENIQHYKIVLASNSPRRRELLSGLNLEYTVRVLPDIDESYPDTLKGEEIEFYVEKFRPLDKAGAYGVQEWIGFVGVSRLEGSYFNVMGLPVQRLYQELKKL